MLMNKGKERKWKRNMVKMTKVTPSTRNLSALSSWPRQIKKHNVSVNVDYAASASHKKIKIKIIK